MCSRKPAVLGRSIPPGELNSALSRGTRNLSFGRIVMCGSPTILELARLLVISVFVGTNPTGELITSGLPVIQAESSRFRRFDITGMTTSQLTGLFQAA